MDGLRYKDYGIVGTNEHQRVFEYPGEPWIPSAGSPPSKEAILGEDGLWIVKDKRTELLEQISAKKKIHRDSGFVKNGILWDSDPAAHLAYVSTHATFLVDPNYTTKWRASQGVWVDMNLELFFDVYAAYLTHIEQAFQWQYQKEQELAALEDHELDTFEI